MSVALTLYIPILRNSYTDEWVVMREYGDWEPVIGTIQGQRYHGVLEAIRECNEKAEALNNAANREEWDTFILPVKEGKSPDLTTHHLNRFAYPVYI